MLNSLKVGSFASDRQGVCRQRAKCRSSASLPRFATPTTVVDNRRLASATRRWRPPKVPTDSPIGRQTVLQGAASEELLTSSVKFVVPVEVDFGETVKVVGNHPSLGCWDTGNGLELEWNDGHIWKKRVHINPGEYEFKCVVVNPRGKSKWEPGPNRFLKVRSGDVTVDCVFVQIEEGQTNVSVGCKWWHTGMNNIKYVPPFAFESQTAVDTAPLDTPPAAPNSPIPAAGEVQLKMVAAGQTVPHIAKKDKKGEDAYFVSGARDGVIGLADGVGSWGKDGIDPSMYSKGLMKEAKRAVEMKQKMFNAKESMMMAQNKNAVIGSSTCILAILQNNVLDIANVGDSGLKIIRDGKIIFSTEAQEHEFNCPFQLTCLDYTRGDRALDGDEYEVVVQEGDILIMGSDGIFDNLWDDALEETVAATMAGLNPSEFTAMALANAIAIAAHQNAQDPGFYSPWTDGATRAAGQMSIVDDLVLKKTANPYMGGKMDDCTAVVAFITIQP